jgi:hypothetical protein
MSRETNLSLVEAERENIESQVTEERGPDEVLAAPNPGVIVIPQEQSAKFPLGLSGSLTTLADGTPYLLAGYNIALVTGSNGSVTIGSAGNAGWQTYSSSPEIDATTTAPTLPTSHNISKRYFVQGKMLTLMFTLSGESSAGATAGSGLYLIPMPPEYTINTSIAQAGSLVTSYSTGVSLGTATLIMDAAGSGGGWSVVAASSSSLALVGQDTSSSDGSQPHTWGSSKYPLNTPGEFRISFVANIPIN